MKQSETIHGYTADKCRTVMCVYQKYSISDFAPPHTILITKCVALKKSNIHKCHGVARTFI